MQRVQPSRSAKKNPPQWMKANYTSGRSAPEQLVAGLNKGFETFGEDDVALDFTNLTADVVSGYTQTIIEKSNAVYDKIAACGPDANFDDIFQPLIDLDITCNHMECLALNMQHFHPDHAVREASVEAEKALNRAAIENNMRVDVFETVQTYYQGKFQTEKASLTLEENKLVEDTMQSYKRRGLHLGEAQRLRIKEIQQTLSDLSAQYSNNLNEEHTSFVFSKTQLEGMPESWFTKEKEVSPGKFKMTLKYPDIMPAMDYIKDPAIRKKLFTAFNGRCANTNGDLFNRTIKLRHELAQLLGYDNYADYATELKMSKSGANVTEFLADMKRRFKPAYDKDMAAFTQMARQETGNSDYQIKPWDVRYYARQVEEQLNDIDNEQVTAYFPLDAVLKGMLEVYQDLLGLKFVKESSDNKWHEDVLVYSVYNKAPSGLGSQVGTFYLDLHPREGKYGHAAMWDFVMGADLEKQTGIKGKRRLPLAAMACNFPQDGCLEFDNVTTLFHEFGHVMHGLCGKTQLSSYNGTHVQSDFVESPSQMLENWCYVPEVLKRMSRHRDTGQPIPESLIEKIKAKQKINQGYHYWRQLSFGLFDMALHTAPICEKRVIDANAVWANIQKEMFGFEHTPGTNFPATFGHLMGGYQAGYYGYLWAETRSADMFSKFKDNPMDSKLGLEYRTKILEVGGSVDANTALTSFLGRETTMDAFLEDVGLEAEAAPKTNKRRKRR